MSHELLRNHRNIVSLLGITWTDQQRVLDRRPTPTPTLLVERAAIMHGRPLTLQYWVEGTLPADKEVRTKTKLLTDVASGLAALHALGVVHGDIKPENILLFCDDTNLVAKISDFGFCLPGDDELQAAKGGTPLWNAPECMEDAEEDLLEHKSDRGRDIYSYGLLIWLVQSPLSRVTSPLPMLMAVSRYVLFEELPFEASVSVAKASKRLESMKDKIDVAFAQLYRPSLKANQGSQEQFDVRSRSWIVCEESHQHILRFLMQWILVRDPALRRLTLDIYRGIFDDSTCHERAKLSFITPGRWDYEWNAFGHPAVRRGRLDLGGLQR